VSAVLDLRVKRQKIEVPEADWGWKSEAAVFTYMVDRSGLKDKTVAIEIGVDSATLTRVKQGVARPSDDQIHALMDCTGSEAWLIYHNLRRGYDPRTLRRLETDVERENRELKERLAQLEHEREVEMRVLRELHGRPA
jgi:hypothetical protein